MLGRLVFAMVLFITFLLFLIPTLGFRSFKDKLFPLLAIIPALIMLAYEINREFADYRRKKVTQEKIQPDLRSKYLAVGVWMMLSLGMYWLIGFLSTTVLLPFLYLRYHRESWHLSISVPLGSGIFFYTVFSLAMEVRFYQGLLFERIFG
jgi:hypothetical protein